MNAKNKNGDNNSDSSAKAAKLKFEAEIKRKDLIIESLQKELSNAKERIKFLEQEQQKWNDKEIGKIKESPEYDVIVLSSDSEEDDLDDDNSGISDTENEVLKLASLDSDENVAKNNTIKASSNPAAKILDSEEENEEDEMESENESKSEESNAAKNDNNKNSFIKLAEKLCFEEEEELDSDEEIVEDEPESEEEETSDCGESATTKTTKIKTLSNRYSSSEEEEDDELNSEEENLDSSDESEEDDPLCTQFVVPTSEEEEESNSDEDETVSEEDKSDSELDESDSEKDDAIDNKIKKRKVIESSDSENHESDSKENIDVKPSLKRCKIEQSTDSWPHQMDDTKMLIKQEPTWLLSQSHCNFFYRSHSDNEEEFLKACIKKLFNVGERILPENRLDIQKKNEALKIMAHYFMETKMEHHQNHMYRILGKFRQYDRQHFYRKITSKKGIIGVCSNGEYFFYSKFNHRYLPYIDGKCKHPLKTVSGNGVYAIPKKYRYVEFITIIHISDKRRHAYHLLEPATGNLEKHINNKYKDGKK